MVDNREPFEEEKVDKKGRFQSIFFDWGESIVVALIAIVVIFTFFGRLVGVDGSSMLPTLHEKDIMLVSNFAYTPEKSDIIVLHQPDIPGFIEGPIVKRIIATGGDEIDINFDLGKVYVNGEELDEPYLNDCELPMLYEGMDFPQVVPEGCVFVMGDNRNGSTDSRHPQIGMVDERYIIGQVKAVIWPISNFGGKT